MSFDHQLVSAHFGLLYTLSSHENIHCTCFTEPDLLSRLDTKRNFHAANVSILQPFLQ